MKTWLASSFAVLSLSGFVCAPIPALTSPEVKGDTLCPYGARDCNRCAHDVPGSFARIDSGRHDSYELLFNPKTDDSDRVWLKAHIQGVARLPGVGRENWFVFSKHDDQEADEAGLVFVEFPFITSNGNKWAGAKTDGKASRFLKIPNTDHPGGIQATGRILAVPAGCSESADVECITEGFVDFVEAFQPAALHTIFEWLKPPLTLTRLARLWLPGNSPYAAITKLADGRHLLFAASSKDEHSAWIYTTNGQGIDAATTWLPRGVSQVDSKFEIYQSANFVTECGTGDLYLFGMWEGDRMFGKTDSLSSPGSGQLKEYVDLFKVATGDDGRLALSHVNTKTFRRRLGGCTFRAAGSVHVTPDGNLVIYCIEKAEGFRSKRATLEEFVDK